MPFAAPAACLPFSLHTRGRRVCARCVGMAWLAAAVLAWAGNATAAELSHQAGASALAALSLQARQVHAWIVDSGDQQNMPFALIDKTAAQLHLFDATGVLRASSPVLLGLARGDHSVPGIGERKMSDIRPNERTTPAGRFVSEPPSSTLPNQRATGRSIKSSTWVSNMKNAVVARS